LFDERKRKTSKRIEGGREVTIFVSEEGGSIKCVFTEKDLRRYEID